MASSHWKHPSVWRVVSVAGASTALTLLSNKQAESSKQTPRGSGPDFGSQDAAFFPPSSFTDNLSGLSNILRPAKTAMEGLNPSEPSNDDASTEETAGAFPVKEYDFVIVGHGIAGKSALKTLRELCPQASIAVIDPMRKVPKKRASNIDYFSSSCEGFHPLTRQVQLSNIKIRYRHAILVATGSRGAPPPHYLLDEKALGRILELRPTLTPNDTTRPIWDPQTIRQSMIQAAKRGDKVAVVGSGWEAVELAVAVSANRKRNRSASTLVFGSKGPLSHVVPQYLSAAVAKRLVSDKHRIQILHRSLIRYIGSDYDTSNDDVVSGLQLHTAKSYDLLDAARTQANWLVVAPEITGPMGTATLPTTSVPTYLQSAQEGRAWYQTWSHMSSAESHQQHTNLLACYADDGRIAVNAELSAGNGVYAAGSVAKFPNPWTGNADVAGYGLEDGTQAGLVAACNMARDYQNRGGHKGLFGFGNKQTTADLDVSRDTAHLKHPVPVWRSDTAVQHSGKSNNNSLKEAGIYALCVGSCDSERFSTQAFWWTNQAKRLKQWLGDDESNASRLSRRKTGRIGSHPASTLRPVYGRGIVYYMDQDAGQIQGVMIWGLPFTDNQQALNSTLVQHMQEIIQTNGGFRNLGQDSELERVQFVEYLTQTSRQLVVDAINPFARSQAIGPDDLPRPLIRYTEVRPVGMRRVRVLNRKQEAQGHGFLGEDLFARSTAMKEVPPAPLPSFDNLRESNDTNEQFEASFTRQDTKEERVAQRRARAQALQDWAVWEWYQRRWEENEDRARPPREEMLWLRKGDENRGISSKERFNESMMKAIFPEGR